MTAPWAVNAIPYMILGNPAGRRIVLDSNTNTITMYNAAGDPVIVIDGDSQVIRLIGDDPDNTIEIDPQDPDNQQPALRFTSDNTPIGSQARLWSLDISSPPGTGLEMSSSVYTSTFDAQMVRQLLRVATDFSAMAIYNASNQLNGGLVSIDDNLAQIAMIDSGSTLSRVYVEPASVTINGPDIRFNPTIQLEMPAGRRAFLLVDTENVLATSNLSPLPVTIPDPIPGCSVNFSTNLPNAVLKVCGEFDFDCTAFSAGVVCSGALFVDGVESPAHAIFEATAVNQRGTYGQSWKVEIPDPGNHIVELRASRTVGGGGGTYRAVAQHTTMDVSLYE